MVTIKSEISHVPVLLEETVHLFDKPGPEIFVDATLGLGGHSAEILGRYPNAKLVGIDQDPDAIEAAGKRLAKFGERARIYHANFSEIKRVLFEAGVRQVSGVLADLGVSSMQFDSEDRGFSFRYDAPLDMRMDPTSGSETAAEILATRSEKEIADLIYEYGEERASRRIARKIVWKREQGEPIETTFQLADLVASVVKSRGKKGLHPATQTFQALRIAVNGEIEILDIFLTDAFEVLEDGGVLAVISFHSLEDRIVKRRFERFAGKCICPKRLPVCQCGAKKEAELLMKKPVVPGEAETKANPRARSAKLRAVRKLPPQ